AAAAHLGRIVRQEQLPGIRGRNACAVVGHDHPQDAVRRIALRLDDDVPAPLHRFDRIIDEIDDDAANLLRVEAYERYVRGEAHVDPDVGENAVVEGD